MARAVGIDLGTSNSVVAYLNGGRAEAILNSEGGKVTPSVVLYTSDEEPIVGDLAKRQILTQPRRAIRSVKSLIGRRFEESADQRARLPYETCEMDDQGVGIVIDGQTLAPEEISAEILKKMKRTAEEFLRESVDKAVITVPAHFNDSQRQATKAAAEAAGLDAVRIINEPTAAALAYGLKDKKTGRVAVFDFGGGTFDITLLDLDEDVFEVRSTNGDTSLGGDNIDAALSDKICDWILEETEVDPRADLSAHQRVRDAAEKAKCELSTLKSTLISLPFIVAAQSGPRHFSRNLTREDFEDLAMPILEKLKPPCWRAMTDAGWNPGDIDEVILVGGSTRIPAVHGIVQEIFGRPPVKTVNPDEAVALGAAIQAGIITGEIEEVLLLDVTPLSLGIEVEGGLFRTIIPRNSSIPTSASRRFTTVRGHQDAVLVHVLQGERPNAKENRTLSHFRLTGVSPAPAGVPEIDVQFNIDANGILSVSATDLTSGSQQAIVVQAYTAAKTKDVERIAEDAETHAEEDLRFVQNARVRQRILGLQRMVYDFLDSNEANIDKDDNREIRRHLMRMDVAMAAMDSDAMQEAEVELMAVCEKYSDIFYFHRTLENES